MRRRLVVLALATTGLVAIAFLVPLFALVDALATDRASRPAELAAQSLAPAAALLDEATLGELLAVTANDLGGTASVHLADGRVLGTPVATDAAVQQVRTEGATATVQTEDTARSLVPVVAGDRVHVVDVRVGIDRSEVRTAQLLLAGLGIVLVGVATLLADRLGRRTVAAADALTTTADRLRSGDLSASAGVEDPPDLARVSRAMDELAARIDELLAETRERAADLSHGLRTPLTALRLDVERLVESPERATVLADLDELERTVSAVIDQARRPSDPAGVRGVDLVAVVRDRATFWTPLAEDEGRTLTVTAPDDAVGVPLGAREAVTLLDVLLDNVLRHTPAGTDAELTVERRPEGGVLLSVRDRGPGPPAGVDVLERGRSGGGGSGLGLDIARATVEGSGGRLTMAPAPGGGALVTAHWP